MRLIRAKNYDDMSLKAANIIAAQVSLNPKSVLGLATGSTPIGTYRHLVEWYQKGELDFGKAVSINLDEYCGLSGDHPQSYRRFMRENLFDHINIPADRSFLPDGTQTDSALECAQYDRIIEEHNGIDLQLLGIGRNAHIGFNEPDSCFACGTHQVTLTESTIAANTRFFENEAQVPRQAYSMGMQAIMQAKRVLLIASGAAPSIDTMQALMMKLLQQKDPFGDSIMVKPKYVIVPVGYGFKMSQILETAMIDVTGIGSHTANALYQYRNQLTVIEEGALNALAGAGNAVPWFIVGDKSYAKSIQVDYLNGQETPTIRRMETPGQLGFVWDIFLDWGITAVDFRGIAKNPGVTL